MEKVNGEIRGYILILSTIQRNEKKKDFSKPCHVITIGKKSLCIHGGYILAGGGDDDRTYRDISYRNIIKLLLL